MFVAAQDQGKTALTIPPGGRLETPITFETPPINSTIFVTLRVRKDAVERFVCDLTSFTVTGGGDFTSDFNGKERTFK